MEYTHLVSCAGLVTNDEGKILLVKSPLRGWEYPGGIIEPGETFQEALRREIREESGVEVEITGFVGICKNIEKDIVNIDFTCRYTGGELTTSDESTEVVWVTPEEAMDMITFPLTEKRLANMLSDRADVSLFGFKREPFETFDDERFEVGKKTYRSDSVSIVKNEKPILEFDTDTSAVIMPDHEKLGLKLPKKAVFAFLAGYVDEYAAKNGARIVSHFVSATKNYPIYILNYKGEDICLCQAPAGAAPAVQILDWLIAYGVREVISVGSCGALVDLPEGEFIVPVMALRDEGTSYHYAPPSRFIAMQREPKLAIDKSLSAHNLKCIEVTTWSTDGFYRETREMVEYRKSEGCSVVEMECSALAACAQMRGAQFGMILFTADTLANIEKYDERNWGGDAHICALELALDAVHEM